MLCCSSWTRSFTRHRSTAFDSVFSILTSLCRLEAAVLRVTSPRETEHKTTERGLVHPLKESGQFCQEYKRSIHYFLKTARLISCISRTMPFIISVDERRFGIMEFMRAGSSMWYSPIRGRLLPRYPIDLWNIRRRLRFSHRSMSYRGA